MIRTTLLARINVCLLAVKHVYAYSDKTRGDVQVSYLIVDLHQIRPIGAVQVVAVSYFTNLQYVNTRYIYSYFERLYGRNIPSFCLMFTALAQLKVQARYTAVAQKQPNQTIDRLTWELTGETASSILLTELPPAADHLGSMQSAVSSRGLGLLYYTVPL